jgi:hypothetical protein
VPDYNYVIEASANLFNWVSLVTNTSPFQFADTNPSSSDRGRKQFFQEVGMGKSLVFLSLAASKASVVEKSLL